MTKRSFRRRGVLGAALSLSPVLALGGCLDAAQLFGQKPKYTLSPRGDRMVRWLQHDGHDVMMAPDALAVMGITNEGRDIPARQIAEGEPGGEDAPGSRKLSAGDPEGRRAVVGGEHDGRGGRGA